MSVHDKIGKPPEKIEFIFNSFFVTTLMLDRNSGTIHLSNNSCCCVIAQECLFSGRWLWNFPNGFSADYFARIIKEAYTAWGRLLKNPGY